jgi:hypothetical protein
MCSRVYAQDVSMTVSTSERVLDAQRQLHRLYPHMFGRKQQWIYLGRMLNERARITQLQLRDDYVIQVHCIVSPSQVADTPNKPAADDRVSSV